MVQADSNDAEAPNGHHGDEDAAPEGRCLGAGCIMHEQSGACALCDEDGADRIAKWVADHPEC